MLPGRTPGLHLSEQGRAQAQQLAERLAELGIDAIYSSPLERARETAAPSALRAGLPVNTHLGLVECDFGDWTGAALAELARLPQWHEVQNSPSTFRFPGGESFTQLQTRMAATLDGVRAAHEGGVVVCFSHANPIKAAIAHAMGTPLDHFQRIDISPASVSAISYAHGRPPSVLVMNSVQATLRGLHGTG